MKIRKDNRGVALITVVIGVMFCLLLTSTMLRVSLLGLNSRSINNQTSDTFYNAETAIDSMALNVQNLAAKAWEETKASNTTSSIAYVKKIYSYLMDEEYPNVADTVMDITPTDKSDLIDVLDNNIISGGRIISVGNVEKYIGTTNTVEGFIIKDIKVEYVNSATGMLSRVKTDLTVRAPLYKKTDSSGYSMLAGGGMDIHGQSSQAGVLRLSGNSYSGYKSSSYHEKETSATRADSNADYNYATAVECSNKINMFYEGSATINGDMYITNNSRVAFIGGDVTVRGCIIIDSSSKLFIKEGTTLKCRAIYVKQDSASDITDSKWLIGPNGTYSTGTFASQGGLSGGDSVNTSEITHLPYGDKENPSGTAFDSTFNDYGPLFLCTNVTPDSYACESVSTIVVNNGQIADENVKIEFDASLEPKKNIEGYDIEYLKIVDIEYMNYVYALNWGNYPENYVSSQLATPDEKTYTIDGVTKTDEKIIPSAKSGGMGRHLTMDGVTNTVQVMVGKADTVANNGNFFVLTRDQIKFNDFNNNIDVYGIFISPNVVIANQKDGGTSHIKPLSSVSGANLTSDTDSTKTNYQVFVDYVGTGYMDKGNGGMSQYYMIDNLVHGGVASLYSEDSSTEYKANVTVNSKMNLVTFSNFERY